MAQITVDRDQVRLVRTDLEGATFGPASTAVNEGRYVTQNTAGKFVHGGSGGQPGIAFSRAIRGNYTVSVMQRGLLELGAGLQGVAIGTTVFADPSDGTLHDATGTGFVEVGKVSGHQLESRQPTRRLLRVNL